MSVVTGTAAPGKKMKFNIEPGEHYTIRRKVFKIFGAAFHIYDPTGGIAGYCKQKAFKLKEDIRIYTDESMSQELVTIKARSVIDFGSTYDVTLPDGMSLGSLRRKGLASTFLRDSWLMFDERNQQVAKVEEDNAFAAFCRRYIDYVSFFFPQRFTLKKMDGTEVAKFRQHFNPLIQKITIDFTPDVGNLLDRRLGLAAGILLSAIEERQGDGLGIDI